MKKHFIILSVLFLIGSFCFAITDSEKQQIENALPNQAVVQPQAERTVLVFDLCNGFKHSSIPYWDAALEMMGQKTGAFNTVISSDMSIFNEESLKKFDAICLNNTTKLTFDESQKKALLDFVKGGKGIVGIHAATDNFYDFPEAAEMMGGIFKGHPWTAGGTWTVKIDDASHPLMKSFGGKGFAIKDEIYRTSAPEYSRDKQRVLMSLDMSVPDVYNVNGLQQGDFDTGLSWIKKYGDGRVFYGSLGHNHDICWNSAVLAHYLAGIQYAIGDLKVDDSPVPLAMGTFEQLIFVLKDYDWTKSREPLSALSRYIRVSAGTEGFEEVETVLNDLLTGDQLTAAGKDYVCRELAIVGTDRSLPVLVSMLESEETADIALYALRQNTSEKTNAMLREALPELGYAKVAVVNMLGDRGDDNCVDMLAGMIGSEDKQLTLSAINSLGHIGGKRVASVLASNYDKITPELADVYWSSLLEAAKKTAADDEKAGLRIFNSILTGPTNDFVKYSALKGSLDCGGELAVVLERAADTNFAFRVMLDVLRYDNNEDFAQSVIAKYPDYSLLQKGLVLNAMADGKNMVAVGFVKDLVENAPADECVEALKAMAKLYDTDCVLILANKAVDSDPLIAQTARETLYSISGEDIDVQIIRQLDKQTNDVLVELVKSCGQRYITKSTPKLIELTASDDRTVKREAFESLKLAADTKYISQFTDMLLASKNTSEKKSLEKIIINAINKTDKALEVEKIESLWSTTDNTNKKYILNILGSIGLDRSVPIFEKALSDEDVDLQYAAIEALSQWPTDKPKDQLLEYAKNSDDKKKRILSLRGYIKLVALPSDRPADQTVDMYFNAMKLAETDQERKMILSGLSVTKSPKAFLMISEYLDNPQLKAEAEVALVKLGWWVRHNVDKEKMKTVIKKICDTTSNTGLKAEATQLYSEI